MATKTKILFTLADGSEQKYSLSRDGEYIFGTSDRCDITLDDPTLDGTHGKFVADETADFRWFIKVINDGSILVLEDGAEQQLGNTHLRVFITEELEAEIEVAELEEDGDNEPSPVLQNEDPSDNERQLEDLKKAQQLRELKSSIILIVVCGILSFAAGVVWRLMQ